MRKIYQAEGNRSLLLYPYEKRIYMRSLLGERAEKAVVLAYDYLDNLSDVFYQDTIYYAYISQKHEVVVKNILEQKELFSGFSPSGLECFLPTIEVISDRLVVLCFIKNPLNQKYYIKGFFPLEKKGFLLSEGYEGIEEKEIGCIDKQNMIYLKDKNRIRFWKIQSKSGNWETQRLYVKEQSELEIVIKEADKRKQLLKEKESLIESIKKQYEELMQTATAYREEAIKWREKYYGEKRLLSLGKSEENVKK